MKLNNTTSYSNRFLRRMVSWCCKELGLPVSFVKSISFGNRRVARFSGHCQHWKSGCRIVVNIDASNDRFPWTDNGTSSGIKGIVRTFADRTDCLVNVTAHELRHAMAEIDKERTRGNGRRVASSERTTEFDAQKVQAAFNANRDTLLAAWNEPLARKAAPKQSAKENRADKARANLANWVRKSKLAATKVRKYKNQVRYYDRQATIAATRSSQSKQPSQ